MTLVGNYSWTIVTFIHWSSNSI